MAWRHPLTRKRLLLRMQRIGFQVTMLLPRQMSPRSIISVNDICCWLYVVDSLRSHLLFPLHTANPHAVLHAPVKSWTLLASGVFFKFSQIKLRDMTSIWSVAKQHDRWPWTNTCACIDWLRALVHHHCDLVIEMTAMKTWCCCWSFKGDLPHPRATSLTSKCNVNVMKIIQMSI